jgi:hypothetical protein
VICMKAPHGAVEQISPDGKKLATGIPQRLCLLCGPERDWG